MMTAETTKARDLIYELLASFVDFPGALAIEARPSKRGVEWVVKPAMMDNGKLLGHMRSHLNALTYLVACLGLVDDNIYRLHLITNDEPPAEPVRRPNLGIAEDFDPSAATALMLKWVSALEIPAMVTAERKQALVAVVPTYLFTITVTDEDYYQALTMPIAGEFADTESLITSFGVLWRAIGKFNGCRFEVKAVRL